MRMDTLCRMLVTLLVAIVVVAGPPLVGLAGDDDANAEVAYAGGGRDTRGHAVGPGQIRGDAAPVQPEQPTRTPTPTSNPTATLPITPQPVEWDLHERYAAIWEQSTGPAWEARHGLTADQYQAEFDRLVGQGYRLVDVSGSTHLGEVLYAAIWEQSAGPAWQARHGLTGVNITDIPNIEGEYQAEFNRLAGQGYRPIRVSGHGGSNGIPYLAAIWERSDGPPWVARHNLTGAEYQAEFDRLVGQGYRLVDVSGYNLGGVPHYAAIWEQSAGPAWQARHGLTADEYQAEFDQLAGQGYRPVRVSGYGVHGTDYYAAIWEQSASPAWVARHRLSAAEYQAEFDRLVGQGYRLVDVSGYGCSVCGASAASNERRPERPPRERREDRPTPPDPRDLAPSGLAVQGAPDGANGCAVGENVVSVVVGVVQPPPLGRDGTAPWRVPPIVARLFVDDEARADELVRGIGPVEWSKTVMFGGVTLGEGPHMIYVVADADGDFAEDDEGNNGAELAVTCAAEGG